MIASALARGISVCTALTVLAVLILTGTSQARTETGSFAFQETFTDLVDDSGTCLGSAATGTISGTETVTGRFTENGPPALGFHVRGSARSDFRVDYQDGRYLLGSGVAHFSENASGGGGGVFAGGGAFRESAVVYGPDNEPLDSVTIHGTFHLTFKDANGNFMPDPGEITANVERFRLACG